MGEVLKTVRSYPIRQLGLGESFESIKFGCCVLRGPNFCFARHRGSSAPDRINVMIEAATRPHRSFLSFQTAGVSRETGCEKLSLDDFLKIHGMAEVVERCSQLDVELTAFVPPDV